MTNSSFGTLSLTQTGGGPDHSNVSVSNSSVTASALVSLGTANGDVITLTGNAFTTAPTTLLEGNGGPSNSELPLGNSDSVTVTGSSYKSLNVTQLLNGTNDNINVSAVTISEINSSTPVVVDGVSVVQDGVNTVQGNGAYDITKISGVTYVPIKGLQTPPKPIVFSNITVVQGNGSVGLASPPTAIVNDSASVMTSNVPGNISITQTDVLANSPSYNTATISGDTAGGYNHHQTGRRRWHYHQGRYDQRAIKPA